MQTVFRIASVSRNKSHEVDPRFAKPKEIRPRRSHRKSRRGCQNCKLRRVKCCENVTSGCLNCKQHGIRCDYLDTSEDTETVLISQRCSPTMCQVSTPNAQVNLIRSLSLNSTLPASLKPRYVLEGLPRDIASKQQTLTFFELFTCSTVNSTMGVPIFKNSIMAIAQQRPYLMHAILGIAATHITAVNGITNDEIQLQRFRKTESYHWHHAIRLYRRQLTQEAALDHADALITTCMLLIIHSFYLAVPETSFIQAPEPERRSKLAWLFIPMGFSVVLQHGQQFVDQSVWVDLLKAAMPARNGWTIALTDADEIYRDFLDVCDVTSTNINDPNIYKDALKHLFAVLQVENINMQHLAQLMAFMGRLHVDFRGLLIAGESRALMILLYWMMAVKRLNAWWAHLRVYVEARAIIDHLQFDPSDGIQKLLVAPKMVFTDTAINRRSSPSI